ncbi:hypothetical protein M434DRAFT_371192 [Hypoxylon sp. CO27-5]|nr:hypothetical protein M434DRAFT_371192 [Hypoxylon sp. CO27-5]
MSRVQGIVVRRYSRNRQLTLAVGDLHDTNLLIIASLLISVDLPSVLHAALYPASYPTQCKLPKSAPDHWRPYLTGWCSP